MYKKYRIVALYVCGVVGWVINFNALYCMQQMPPKDSQWRIIHVVPVVNQPEESYEGGNLTIKDKWYVLLGKNVNRGSALPDNDKWDVLTATQSDMQPQFFGIATIKTLPGQRTKQFFMKTIYNTLELLTGTWKALVTARKGLYTRYDYAYYYGDEPIPYYFLDTKNAELYVFLKLSNKKNSIFLEGELRWLSKWKEEFTWVPVDELATMARTSPRRFLLKKEEKEPYVIADYMLDLFGHNPNKPSTATTQWQTALQHFDEYEKTMASKASKPKVQAAKQDIEEEYAQHARDSWLFFDNGIYFNEKTKDLKAFTLNDGGYPLKFANGKEYSTLQGYRDHVIETTNSEDRPRNEAPDQVQLDAVYEGLKKKLTDYPALQEILRKTGSRVLIYGNKKDSLFGTGPYGHGDNCLGRMLMVLRENLKATESGEEAMIFTKATAFPLDFLAKKHKQVNPAFSLIRYLRYRAGTLPSFTLPQAGSVARKALAKHGELEQEAAEEGLELEMVTPIEPGQFIPRTSENVPVKQAEVRRRRALVKKIPQTTAAATPEITTRETTPEEGTVGVFSEKEKQE